MSDRENQRATEAEESTQDEGLDELLRAVAHARPHDPPSEPALPGDRWGAGDR
jgi:hypothetical protein